MVNVSTIPYSLLVPLDLGTKIEINGQNYTAHSFTPNSVHACKIPSTGLSGSLIYGGLGSYSEMDRKIIDGSIVVLEFNSQDNWIKAASLGAKGVIFLPPNNTDRFEAEVKSIDIPLNFPRIYINDTTTAKIIKQISKQTNQMATIYSNIEWTLVYAENVMGLLPGLDDDIIIISAHFDSSSVVPAVAPGADEACGIATLFELIRIMKDNNIVPQKTIMFLALSGHNQAAAGAREFVYQNYKLLNVDSGIKLFISLDLSVTNNKIGINPYGYLYQFKLQYTTVNRLIERIQDVGEGFLQSYSTTIQEETGFSFEVKSYCNRQEFKDIAPITFLGDQEPFVASNVIGLSLFTTESHRLRFNTPIDFPKYTQSEKEHLKSQVIYSICALSKLVIEEALGEKLDLQNKDFSLRHGSHVGFGIIEGHCKEYNETIAWLTNVPNALIRVRSRNLRDDTYGEYSYITKADDEGFYQVRGVSSSQPDYPLQFVVEAFVFDSKGQLIKSINLGPRGQYFRSANRLTSRTITINPTVFDCGTVTFFEVLHPYTQVASAELLNYQIIDPDTRTPFFSYGYTGLRSVSLVFLAPNTSSVMVGRFPDGVIGIYATNSSVDTLRGNGYKVKGGETKNLGISAYTTARDFQSMTKTYIDLYTSYNIYDALADDAYSRANSLIKTANDLKNNLKYSESIVLIKEVQTWSYDAFKQARKVIEDGTSTTIFFAILLIPFAFALSSLLFNFESGIKRISAASIIYGITFGFFYLIHPGMHLSKNIAIIILGVIALIFVFPALYMIYQEGYDFLKSLRIKLVGAHFVDTSRTSTILIAMSTGISRMKKRKGRTIIALSGIVLITFSLTLFTSASTQVGVYSSGINRETPYNGVYFRTKDWNSPLSNQLLETLEVQNGNISMISSRWWLYPTSDEPNGYVNIASTKSDLNWQGSAILGLTPEEPNFQPIIPILSAGRWFNNSNNMECILFDSISDKLDVSINDTVSWTGIEFKVIGIIDANEFDKLKDFDDEEITPKNNLVPSPSAHLRADETFILPAQTAKSFGAALYSISILIDHSAALELADTTSTTYGRFLEIRVGYENEVSLHRRITQSLGQGFVELGIPLGIAVLLMINTSISTVYESRKEINTFTSLGLAPFHIAGLFLAEFLVYAIIGSVIGYLGGITSAVVLSALGIFPESLAINYSSGSVVNALSFGIIGILLSTVYPLRISAKMSVPSVRRAWELTTSPEESGENWNIPLPFVASTEQESEGILEFLREFFEIYESESVGGTFFAQNITLKETNVERKEKHLSAVVTLAPFDMGLKQTFDLFTYLDEIKYRWVFEINLKRLEGILSAWETSVRRFIDSIRKQLLIWRNLSKDEKALKAEQYRSKSVK
ncbi:MAG: M28 family peptidase [Promethearchaeota archaeon]